MSLQMFLRLGCKKKSIQTQALGIRVTIQTSAPVKCEHLCLHIEIVYMHLLSRASHRMDFIGSESCM